MRLLKQSTAVTIVIGPFVDDTDGKTAETGLTLSQSDVLLWKEGGTTLATALKWARYGDMGDTFTPVPGFGSGGRLLAVPAQALLPAPPADATPVEDEVDPADEARTYREGSYPRRMWVITAGSVMHVIIALLLVLGVYVTAGRYQETGRVWIEWVSDDTPLSIPGMFGGGQGQLALNQLLVTMDGVDNPPFFRRVVTNKVNSFLDAIYIVPRRLGRYTGHLYAAGLAVMGSLVLLNVILRYAGTGLPATE